MSSLSEFRKRHGNPEAVFLHGYLKPGQKVRVILQEEARVVDGIASGKRKNGKHLIRIKGVNSKWMLSVDRDNVLVSW